MTTDEGIDALKMLSELTESPLEIKEVINGWMLLTYDLKTDDEGNKARQDFLKEASRIGAIQHTESVYMMPTSTTAGYAALKLANVGRAVIWYATVDDEDAKALTIQYDTCLNYEINELEKRLKKIIEHIAEERHKRAVSMLEHSQMRLEGMRDAVVRRGNPVLAQRFWRLRSGYEAAGKVIS